MTDEIRTARGTSMKPLLRSGDRLGIRRVEPASLRPGDIVAFQSRMRVIVHRVIGITRVGDRLLFREKGDNRVLSSTISAEQILGKTVWKSTRGIRTNLDRPRGLRLIVLRSRAEAALFDALRSAWLRTGGKRRPRAAARLLHALHLILWPAKVLLAPVYFYLYRPEPHRQRDGATGALLAAVRTICGLVAEPFPGDADWDDLLCASSAHGIDGLLYEHVAKDAAEDATHELKLRRYRGALQYAVVESTLGVARKSLTDQGIPFVVLKGPPLASELYDDPSLRPSSDVDLLVRKNDVDRTLAALTAATHTLHGSGSSRALARRSHFHLVLDPLDLRHAKIEVHWDLVDRANLYRVDTESVFDRTRKLGADTVLGIEDTLLYLCLHAAKHGLFNAQGLKDGRGPEWFCREASGNRLIWFIDLDRYLARHGAELDWPALRERCIEWNVFDEVGDTLRVLDLLLPGSHADVAIRELGMARARGGGTSADGTWHERAAGRLLSSGNSLVIRPARLLTMRSFLFPSPARVMRYYGVQRRWMLPLLYVRHPFHMARRLFAA